MPAIRRKLAPIEAALLALCIALACCAPGMGSAATPLPLAQHVDLSRMMGGWHIVATIPNGFEKGMVAPYDVYSPRPGGGVREDFYVQSGGFGARRRHFVVHDWVRPGTGNAHWRVQIFWPINLPFLLLYVDPDYRYALWGEEGRGLGWIYARSPQIPDADYQALLGRFRDLGYDPGRLRRIVQRPDDIGAPGFWSDGIRR